MNIFKNKITSTITIFLLVFSYVGYLVSCTHDDQVLEEMQEQVTDPTELVSLKTVTAPVVDGTIEAVWGNAKSINFTTTVPDPGNEVFQGYVDNKYNVTLRALHDDNNIYFLAEWNDVTEDFNRQTWYFDPSDKKWKQESRVPTFDAQGNMTRRAFYEDKLAMLFNVNNSVEGWNSATCYASCHTSLSPSQGLARHYTNSSNERIDMRHWKGTRTNINQQFDDQYQDDTFPNGRKSDSKVSGGYTDNIQELNNGTDDVKVPKYFIPGNSNYYWITQQEIDAGTAKLITAVDANGILTYAGGTIDPNTDLEFQRKGETTGSKGIPSVHTTPFVGNRGDIAAVGVHTGQGWILEIKRALRTDDTDGQDVDFSSLEEQAFGVAIFDNAAIAHSITAGLKLKFEENQ